MVYVVRSRQLYKIGRTDNLEARLTKLQSDCPQTVKVIYQLKTSDSAGLERYLHVRFASCHVRGEWYHLTAADIDAISAIQVWPSPELLMTMAPMMNGVPTPRKLKTHRRPVTCLRCGYQWRPYGRRLPRSCARCKSAYWNLPRERGV